MDQIFRAYPRHSVDISAREYQIISSLLFSPNMFKGNFVQQLEAEFSRYNNVSNSIAIPSARLGLFLILKYYNYPKGTEVVITPFTHWSIFTVIKASGLKPVFCDINENTYNIDPESVEKVLSSDTKLLILTHMWGQMCKMGAFMELKQKYDLKIIEDCAMAAGAEYLNRKAGSFGNASIFSFGKAKTINTFGGGMLCTEDNRMSEYIRNILSSFHYEKRNMLSLTIINSIIANILTRPRVFFFTLYPILKFLNIRDPYNPIEHKRESSIVLDRIPEEWKVRFSNIQAAVGLEQLRSLDRRNERRIENAKIFESILNEVEGIRIPFCFKESKHIYLYYAVYIKKQGNLDFLRKELIRIRIDSQLNELTGPRELIALGVNPNNFPVFKEVSNSLLVIPNGLYLSKEDCLYIANNLKKIAKRYS